ncbi:hypothetical protein ACFYXW_27840 [Streptomyces sp. NPDC001981]|uniref:DUF7848 domain-containing protein n=1 Tax=Streptomyces sp. NPDC001981 TaxID=3364628 RepID=UPI0036BB682F
MSPRTIMRTVLWRLHQSEPPAPQEPLYEVECTTCEERSECTEGDRLAPELWTLKHTAANPSHRVYRAIVTMFWQVSPAEGQEVADPPSLSSQVSAAVQHGFADR